MKQRFNKKLYGQRAQVETVFSMIKRRWGTAVRARQFMAQQREMWLMVLTHNLAVFWLVKELFYRAGMNQNEVRSIMGEPERCEGYPWGSAWLYRTAMTQGIKGSIYGSVDRE